MSGYQPRQYDPRQPQGYDPRQYGEIQPQQQYRRPVPPLPDETAAAMRAHQEQYRQQPQQQYAPAPRKASLTAAEQFWYVLQCIAMGAGYWAKIPAKKALSDFGMAEMTGAEKFWYILMCCAFGAGYLAKVPTAKALSEMPQFWQAR